MSTHTKKQALPIFGVFFLESAVFGQWIPRIPDIQEGLGLTTTDLGLALLTLPLGTLFGFLVAARVIERMGLRRACQLFLPLWAMLFMGPALARNFSELIVALIVCGMAIGMIETAMNTEAAHIEKALGQRLMSRCHGFWSLGTMAGALLSGAIAQAGVSIASHFLIVLPILALAGYAVASQLPVTKENTDSIEDRNAKKAKGKPGWFQLPPRSLLLLCVMPLGVMMVEGAFIDWSAVFMKQVMAADPWLIAVTYSFFSVVMAIVRLSGDAIASRYGDKLVIRVSGLAASVGIAMFSLAPSTAWAFAASALAGAGVAIVFPLAVSAAANRPGRSSAGNVAALNMIAFTAFLIAPPFIGILSDFIGLRYALLLLAPIAFTSCLLAGEVTAESDFNQVVR